MRAKSRSRRGVFCVKRFECNTGFSYSIPESHVAVVLEWAGDDDAPVPASFPPSQHPIRGRRTPVCPGEVPPAIQAAIWRGTELGSSISSVLSSGFVALDAERPGAGWPCHSLTEILQPQPTVVEWRLLAPVVRAVVAAGQQVVVVGPLKFPHVRGLRYAVKARAEHPFDSAWDMARRAKLALHEMKLLAAADALMSASGHRRQQVWDAAALRATPELLRDAPFDENVLELTAAPEGGEVVFDDASLGLTLRTHPMALLRPQLADLRLMTSKDLDSARSGQLVHNAGIVTLRQQPSTANGTVSISLEDETGVVQVICWKSMRDAQRKELLRSRLLLVHGVWHREGDVKKTRLRGNWKIRCQCWAGWRRKVGISIESSLSETPWNLPFKSHLDALI